jgi:putative hydrolase of the HAD superfamily/5'-nucleotidase
MRFIDRFEAVVFDLNGTLAEGFDRFGEGQDYHATYRSVGGSALSGPEVMDAVEESLRRCLDRYRRGPWDPFPDYVDFVPTEFAADADAIEDTVAAHELGVVPASRQDWLRELAVTHRLGLVSDLWAPSRRARGYLAAEGLGELFDSVVLSCEHGAVKPSPRLFLQALSELRSRPQTTLFVGDNYRRDIEGAAACGLGTAWIRVGGRAGDAETADRIVDRVERLVGIG